MLSTKSASPISRSFPSALRGWVLASRPKTLIAGVSPVAIGGAYSAGCASISKGVFVLCLLFSLFLQIATNWANDYFDFQKGADTASRKGPPRAVQSGWISPKAMRNAALIGFVLAVLTALPLILRIGVAYLPLMLLCPLAGILYTGGKRPLGYFGLGDLFVFVFYGPVAVCFTALALLLYIPQGLLFLSTITGFLSCAILCINNLRDADEDSKCGKMTLVARFGKSFGQGLYLFYLFGAALPLFAMQGIAALILYALFAALPAFIILKKPEQLSRAFTMTMLLLTAITFYLCYAFLWL